jgi:hypothetical protein
MDCHLEYNYKNDKYCKLRIWRYTFFFFLCFFPPLLIHLLSFSFPLVSALSSPLHSLITLISHKYQYKKIDYGVQAGQYYFYFNVLEELDTPGEYYINRTTGMLYFWPPSSISSSPSYVSVLAADLMEVSGAFNVSFTGM